MELIELVLATAIGEAGEYQDVRLLKEDANVILDMLKAQQERIKELEAANASWQKFVPFLHAHGLLNETEGV